MRGKLFLRLVRITRATQVNLWRYRWKRKYRIDRKQIEIHGQAVVMLDVYIPAFRTASSIQIRTASCFMLRFVYIKHYRQNRTVQMHHRPFIFFVSNFFFHSFFFLHSFFFSRSFYYTLPTCFVMYQSLIITPDILYEKMCEIYSISAYTCYLVD